MLSLRIEEKYSGPTILEMEPLFALSNEAFDVRWEGTKPEIALAKKYAKRPLTLVVPTLVAMERTAVILGLEYVLDRHLWVNGTDNLNKPDGKWRDFARDNGGYVARGAVMRALATVLRKGGTPTVLRKAVVSNVLDRVQPADLDVLLIMRLRGARV
jgi:hypothetical protein